MFSFHSTSASRQYRTALCWTRIRVTRVIWAHGFFKSKTTTTNCQIGYCHISMSDNEKKLNLFWRTESFGFFLFPPYKFIAQNPSNMFCSPGLIITLSWITSSSPLAKPEQVDNLRSLNLLMLFLALYCNPAYPTEIRAMRLWTLHINNIFKAASASESTLFNKAVDTHGKENRSKERKHLQTHRIFHLYPG